MKLLLRSTFSLIAIACFSAFAFGATFNVNTTSDTQDAVPGDGACADAGAQCSLRAAITEANALAGDDIINIPAGTYTQALVLANEDNNGGGDWDIRSNITINGAGAATTILQAAASPGVATERVMENILTTNVTVINGVTLRHGFKTGTAGNTTRGGGIRNVGTLTMNDCIVTLNTAPGSGGVRNERTITLNNVTVSNNACNNTGSSCFGGGMYNTLAANSTITITNSTFSGNTSTSTLTNGFGFGAGLGIESGTGFTLNISGSTFVNNTGSGTGTGGSNGNGIRLLANGPGIANITNTTFSGNSGSGGSAIQGSGIQAFTSGAAGNLSGTWNGLTVSGNSANLAAGVALIATGGAMNITLSNSTIAGNTSNSSTGGMLVSNSGSTAAVANNINIVNSTVSGNTANGSGGGIFVEQPATSSTVTVNCNFCTVANNRANNDNSGTDSGGGIFRSTAGTLNLKNSLIGDNSVGTGGSGPDISGAVNSQDYNHIEDITGATIGGTTTNNTTGDALLGPLANNGGDTNTHLPGPGSPVIDTIPNGVNDCGSSVNTDQRGISRPVGSACDKGSVEVSVVAVPAYIAGTVRSVGGRTLRNILVTLSGGGLPQPITVQTGDLGTFRFDGIFTGSTYTLSVSDGKRYTFSPSSRQILLTGNLDNEDFTSTNEMLWK